jgi:catechol 2,3-dioxygenase-like lactoylglutathione lyase family enzyme
LTTDSSISDGCLVEVLPVLPSLDLEATLAFYRDKLGFERVPNEETSYLIIRRGGMELHFWQVDDPKLCENSCVCMRGSGIRRLYEEFRDAGLDQLSPLCEHQPNVEEFFVHDPHWNLLRFSSASRPSPSPAG